MSRVSRAVQEHYTLSDIEKTLKNKELTYSYAEQGELDVIHLIIDAERALELANPTEIQLMTVDLVWRQGFSLVETGRMLGVTPQAVKFNLDLLKVKIQKVVDEWRIKDKEGERKAS
ncbi:hypothetical protein V7128_07475 [Neobacillus vireti]|uniref:hypothetical protein n=1 Tax=Neobacillus vireti TaxID=220686 RepID=UPI002FFE8191